MNRRPLVKLQPPLECSAEARLAEATRRFIDKLGSTYLFDGATRIALTQMKAALRGYDAEMDARRD